MGSEIMIDSYGKGILVLHSQLQDTTESHILFIFHNFYTYQ